MWSCLRNGWELRFAWFGRPAARAEFRWWPEVRARGAAVANTAGHNPRRRDRKRQRSDQRKLRMRFSDAMQGRQRDGFRQLLPWLMLTTMAGCASPDLDSIGK